MRWGRVAVVLCVGGCALALGWGTHQLFSLYTVVGHDALRTMAMVRNATAMAMQETTVARNVYDEARSNNG